MKHITYLLLTFILFVACEADKDINEESQLALSKTSCELTNATNYIIIDVTQGAGEYTVSSSNDDVAKATIDNTTQPAKLYIFGFNIGKAEITVIDKNKNKANVNVTINQAILTVVPFYTLVYLKTGDTKELNPQLQNDIEYLLFSANDGIAKVTGYTDSTIRVTGMSAGKCEMTITKDIVRPIMFYAVEVFDTLPLLIDRNNIQMRQGSEMEFHVFCGNGGYVITQDVLPNLAEVEILPYTPARNELANNAKTIKLKAVYAGTTVLTITDSQNKTVSINLLIQE